MEIIEQLSDLHTVEVSRHGPQESYFEPTAAYCCSCSISVATSGAGGATQDDQR